MLQTERIVGAWRNSAVSKVPPGELVLVTDFDGTLSEVVPDPAQSFAIPEALQALSRLVRLIADVIVLRSGTAEQLEQVVPISAIRLMGGGRAPMPRESAKESLQHFNPRRAVRHALS